MYTCKCTHMYIIICAYYANKHKNTYYYLHLCSLKYSEPVYGKFHDATDAILERLKCDEDSGSSENGHVV